jgi:uncharacterized membrane protein YbhN (UPF0104 family)
MTRGYRLLQILGTIALILSIVGGTDATSTNPGDLNKSNTYRHVGSILFIVLYALLIAVHIACWCRASRLLRHRRTVSPAPLWLSLRSLF